MSQTSSPSRYSGEYDPMYESNYTEDISQKMRVPKRIKVNGDNDDDMSNGVGWNTGPEHDRFDMHVPDRILVMGDDKHVGTRAPPRELQLENSMMAPEPHPGFTRVQTPPRVITLDDHYFPSADDYDMRSAGEQILDKTFLPSRPSKPRFQLEQRLMNNSNRESSPSLGNGNEVMSTGEEVAHLRRQMAKLNRRVMSLELENLHKQQREKVLYAIGIAYLFLKTVLWLNRTS